MLPPEDETPEARVLRVRLESLLEIFGLIDMGFKHVLKTDMTLDEITGMLKLKRTRHRRVAASRRTLETQKGSGSAFTVPYSGRARMPVAKPFARLPKHVGLIPDGNRRWARARGELHPALGVRGGPRTSASNMLDECLERRDRRGVACTASPTDNTKRPRDQREAFAAGLRGLRGGLAMQAADRAARRGRHVLLGDVSHRSSSPTPRAGMGAGMRVNMLVNYGWEWDLRAALDHEGKGPIHERIASRDVSRIDLMVRWGGMRRLSGMLPVQAVYSDFYVVDDLWPDYKTEHLHEALRWYAKQDVTLGG